jgi:hypothetical protein
VLRLRTVAFPIAAALAAAIAYAGSFWLVLLHKAEGGHEHNEPAFLVHWLRDGSLALPGVLAAVWLGSVVLLGAVDRDGRLPARWRSALIAAGAAVSGSVVLAAGSPVHAFFFDATEANGLPAGVHLGRDALIALGVGLPVAALVMALVAPAMALAGRLRRSRPSAVPAAGSGPAIATAQAAAPEPPAILSERGVTRRTFVRVGAGTLATAGVVGTVARPTSRARAVAATDRLELFINEGHVAMVDGALVYMRGFGEVAADDPQPSLTISPKVFLADGRGPIDSRFFPVDAEVPEEGTPAAPDIDPSGPHLHFIRRRNSASFFPRRTIVAESGAGIRLQVTNRLSSPHSFTIDGTVDVTVGPGESTAVDFTAPEPGTYLYRDKTDGPVNRVLGLYGALVVVPAGRENWWTFKDGEAEFERQWLWLLADVDPEWSRLARMGVTIDPAKTPLLPRYFTINDRSGVFSLAISPDEAENRRTHEDTKPSGFQRNVDVRDTDFAADASLGTGQLIRILNAGVAVHQPHFHGNHVWTMAIDNVVLSRSNVVIIKEGHIALQHWEDVVEMDPLGNKAVMLPIKPPPDVVDEVREAQACDWIYPMHCHAEMSQTAGGGLYPGGQVSDWILKP